MARRSELSLETESALQSLELPSELRSANHSALQLELSSAQNSGRLSALSSELLSEPRLSVESALRWELDL